MSCPNRRKDWELKRTGRMNRTFRARNCQSNDHKALHNFHRHHIIHTHHHDLALPSNPNPDILLNKMQMHRNRRHKQPTPSRGRPHHHSPASHDHRLPCCRNPRLSPHRLPHTPPQATEHPARRSNSQSYQTHLVRSASALCALCAPGNQSSSTHTCSRMQSIHTP